MPPAHHRPTVRPTAATAAISARPMAPSETPVDNTTPTQASATSTTTAPAVPSPSCSGRPTAAPTHPPAALELGGARRELGAAPGQLGQAADGQQPERGTDAGADRVGSAAPGDDQDPAGDARRREEVAGPTDDRAQGLVHPGADRTGGGPIEGEGQQDPHGDQGDRPQIGGVVAPDATRRLPAARPGPVRRGRPLRARRGTTPRRRCWPSRGALRRRSALGRHHSREKATAGP